MSNTKHAVYNSDNVSATKDASLIMTAKYMGTAGAEVETAIDNGNIVKISGLMTNSREVYKAIKPSADTEIKDVAIVTTVEENKEAVTKADNNLENYTNVAGQLLRVFTFHSGETFSVSAEAFNGTPAIGNAVGLMDGTKIDTADTVTGTQFGEIIDKIVTARYTLYTIKVKF